MAIKTSTFSCWRLSGKDADAFLKQINDFTPNPFQQKRQFYKKLNISKIDFSDTK
jgi:hypothetical protein